MTRVARQFTATSAAILFAGSLHSASAFAQRQYLDLPLPIAYSTPSVSLYFRGRLSESESKGEEQRTSSDSESRLLKLDISTNGFVYHPALLSYSLSLAPSFNESSGSASGQVKTESSDNTLFYTVSADILNRKPYALFLSSAHGRSELTNYLRYNVVTESWNSTASMKLDNALLPISLRWAWNEIDRESDIWAQKTTHEYGVLRAKKDYEGGNFHLELRDDQQESLRGDFRVLSDRISTSASSSQRVPGGSKLNTTWQSAKSTVNGREFRTSSASSRIQFDHRWNLESSWNVNYNSAGSDASSSSGHGYAGTLSHTLYENLTTSYGIGAATSNGAGKLKQRNQIFRVNYTRRILWGGQIALGQNLTRVDSKDRRPVMVTEVFEEQYTFEGTTTSVIISNANVDVDSILVTDAEGLVVYEEGFDYTVEQSAGTVIIRRNTAAEIGDDSTVLVSYRFLSDPPSERESNFKSTSAQLSFGSAFTLYWRTGESDTTITAGIAPAFLPVRETTEYGARLNYAKTDTHVWRREQTYNDTTLTSTGISERFPWELSDTLRLTVSASYSEQRISDYEGKSTSLSAGLSTSFRLGKTGSLNMGVNLYRERAQWMDNNGWRMTANYSWRFGAWYPRITYFRNHRNNDLWNREAMQHTIDFSVRRRF